MNFAGEVTKTIQPSEQISVPQVKKSLFFCKASDIETSHTLMVIISAT